MADVLTEATGAMRNLSENREKQEVCLKWADFLLSRMRHAVCKPDCYLKIFCANCDW